MIDRCLTLARLSEEPYRLTRTFLSPPTREVHRLLRHWMQTAGMDTQLDAVGNLRGLYPARDPQAPRLLIGSHIDTVPGAGPFDGILGVVLAIALIEALIGRRLRFEIEVVAFSEEEGVRFGVPFLGSRALAGSFDPALLQIQDGGGIALDQAIRDFELDPALIPQAALAANAFGYLEFHIEQGPVLESLNLPLGIVEAIAGQTRMEFRFQGTANHAGTTPMHLRKDALAAAAEWITAVEQTARRTPGLVATVGRLDVRPGAGNVIPGDVRASLDIRHAVDEVRSRATNEIIAAANEISHRRGLKIEHENLLDQSAVASDSKLVASLQRAVEKAGYPVHRMASGAGHDAMVLAAKIPIAMLFLRTPGGISHHPDETVLVDDVHAALHTGLCFLEGMDNE